LPGYLRLSIGNQAENSRLLEALTGFVAAHR
jgi:histidinol-phosphate/aromatic aminotransferase/cobyric acid decarboxylase-like protein